jgi:MFS family permease
MRDSAPSVRATWRERLRAPAISPPQRRVLLALGVANLVDNYDGALLGLALPQIQAGLGISESAIGQVLAVVRLGTIPAVILAVMADHVGRRLLLLITIVAFTVCTFLTALVGNAVEFMTIQFVARTFIAAETILAIVVIAEEFDARHRGWGIGMLGALGAFGFGIASIVFSLVNVLPYGWRALYVIGVVPLLLVAWMLRSLSETRRFAAQRASAAGGWWRGVLRPLRNLVRMYPGRMVALSAALFPFAFVTETTMFFPSKFLQQVHGYSPGDVAIMYLTVGVLGLLGNIVAGVLGDRFGRRRVLIVGVLANGGAAALFYNVSGWVVPWLWGIMVMTMTMNVVLFAALGSELFPTSYRSTASGVRSIIATIGAATGLWLEGVLFSHLGSHAAAITVMLVVVPIAPLVIALSLPETANRELEEVSPKEFVDLLTC